MLQVIQLHDLQKIACIMTEIRLLGCGSLFPDIHGVL